MNHARLLDCTLRDGAYIIDKTFGDETIRGIISGLVKARVDYIEVGFFQDEGFGPGKTVFRNSADAKRYIPENKEGCTFTVLADYSRFSVDNLDVCTGDSIDAVRECFFKHERFAALEACKTIKQKGYKHFQSMWKWNPVFTETQEIRVPGSTLWGTLATPVPVVK